MQYTYRHIINLDGEALVQRIEDSAWIPIEEENGSYIDYLRWTSAGNVPDIINFQEIAAANRAARETV